MKKVALLKNNEICYGSLIYFLEQIGKALNYFGIETEQIDCIDESFMEQEWGAVIGINQETLSVRMDNGDFLFDYLDCPLLAVIVDSPYHHDRLLRVHPHNMHLICLDEGHVEYSRKYYGPFKSVEMGYLLGTWDEPVPYDERAIEVLFTGTRSDIEHIRKQMCSHPQKWVGELFEHLIHEGIKNPNVVTEKQVLRFFEQKGMQISKEDCKLAMAIAGTHAEFYLRGYYREQIISVLLNAGIRVTVVGDGWNEFALQHPENLILLPSVDFVKTADLMKNAKIVLNVMPWFKGGLHDRIPTAMHNGAICVTDSSTYIETHFVDGEDIVLYNLACLRELPGMIEELLNHPQVARRIADRGCKKAQNTYTWENLIRDRFLPHIL